MRPGSKNAEYFGARNSASFISVLGLRPGLAFLRTGVALPARMAGFRSDFESAMYECLGWLTLLLLAQWFFGNLYEAVALMPSLMSIIELKSGIGEPLFKKKSASPVAYYVLAGPLTLAFVFALTTVGLLQQKPDTVYLLALCILLLVAAGLTFYIVRNINLDLFFKTQTDLIRARKLLDKWIFLNYVRLSIAGTSLIISILWLRIAVISNR